MIGLTGQYAAVDEDLTGFENLLLIGRLLELPARRGQARGRASCWSGSTWPTRPGARVKTYSGGMRRRLDLAASLVSRRRSCSWTSRPPAWTRAAGARSGRWSASWSPTGTTVLLTTQYLDEADRLANEIAVIDHGRVIANGTSAELKAKVGGQTLDVRPTEPADLDRVADDRRDVGRAAPRRAVTPTIPGLLSIPVDDADAFADGGARGCKQKHIPVTELALRLASLDEVFMALTGHAR